MKTNQKGFSIVEILIIIVIIGLIGTVGWLVYDRQKSKNLSNTSQSPINTTQSIPKEDKVESPKEAEVSKTTYTFNELGVMMDILDGWEVKTNHTEVEGAKFYNWTVEKAGSDSKINVSSSGFRGGFGGCAAFGDALDPATVNEVAPTQNANFMFMLWSYNYDNQTRNQASIVPVDQTVFRTSSNSSATPIPNKDVKAGNYYFCISEPQPGNSLELNKEPASDFSRKDTISVLASNSTTDNYVPLPANPQSYSDIKTMLTSLK